MTPVALIFSVPLLPKILNSANQGESLCQQQGLHRRFLATLLAGRTSKHKLSRRRFL